MFVVVDWWQIDWVKEKSSSEARGRSTEESRAVRIASGKHVSVDDRRYRVYRPHNSALSVLIIRRARRQDAGIYRCNLSGSSTRHKYMVLNVTGRLRVEPVVPVHGTRTTASTFSKSS